MTFPAPKYLKDDPWFGPAPFSDKQVEYKLAYQQVVEENLLLDDTYPEVENIHEVMYDMATRCGKTTIQLDPVGGSENFQGGSENIHG
tara:strand:- start:265 stop:528 length:264 start_codon:yes stop_codon:yes gene_type:complete